MADKLSSITHFPLSASVSVLVLLSTCHYSFGVLVLLEVSFLCVNMHSVHTQHTVTYYVNMHVLLCMLKHAFLYVNISINKQMMRQTEKALP